MNSPDLSQEDDRSLIGVFLARRDEATFRELYRRQTPALFRVAARLTWGSPVRPDDVVQETWLRAIGHLDQFRFESSLRTWLVAFVVNVTREMLRPRAAVISLDGLVDEPQEPDSDPALIAERDLTPILVELPTGYRTVLVLHDLEGLTHEEIAHVLGIAAGTAKSQLSRARSAARALLGQPGARKNRRLP
ncbi:MAG: RNA polymerase sigma factor [Gammaproteobacteria bacterium]|nr:RNA polymerase sigma factor [Gammaproteobacteria bacterium]